MYCHYEYHDHNYIISITNAINIVNLLPLHCLYPSDETGTRGKFERGTFAPSIFSKQCMLLNGRYSSHHNNKSKSHSRFLKRSTGLEGGKTNSWLAFWKQKILLSIKERRNSEFNVFKFRQGLIMLNIWIFLP